MMWSRFYQQPGHPAEVLDRLYRGRVENSLMFSTARIASTNANGETQVGTGFFLRFRDPAKGFLDLLVTNRHVIEGTVGGSWGVHMVGTDEQRERHLVWKVMEFRWGRGAQPAPPWYRHPNKDIDLCCMPVNPSHKSARREYGFLGCTFIEAEHFPSNTSLESEPAQTSVVMVGYPTGLWDEVNALPILRRGTTASHPAINFCGKPIGVVDMACFEGSSGSPILLEARWPATLLGVLYAGPTMTRSGEIVVEEIPTARRPIAQISSPIHLGYYIKSNALLALKDTVEDKDCMMLEESGWDSPEQYARSEKAVPPESDSAGRRV